MKMTLDPEFENQIYTLALSHGLQELLLVIEKRIVERALDAADGNCRLAAHGLGLNRTTLVEKRRKLKLPIGTRGKGKRSRD